MISVISYNVLAQRYIEPFVPKKPHIKDKSILEWSYRYPLICKHVEDYDIICLQEVELASISEFLFDGYDFAHHVTSKKRNNPIGNLILWKKDKFNCSMKKISSCSVFVELNYGEVKFTLANVHFRAGLKVGLSERLNQVKSCLKMAKGLPMIFCGDFNDDFIDCDTVKKLFVEKGFELKTSKDTCCLYNEQTLEYTYYSFDHVMVHKLNVVVDYGPKKQPIPNAEYPSDHFPVCFKINL
jgi:mRNA deadenylase 3'-5' endonuclease subunit Ccr4